MSTNSYSRLDAHRDDFSDRLCSGTEAPWSGSISFLGTVAPLLLLVFRSGTEDSSNQYSEGNFIATDMTIENREGCATGDLTVEAAIVIIVFFSSISLLAFCSRKGFLHSWRSRGQSDRIPVEDAVKHLYGLGASKNSVSLNDLVVCSDGLGSCCECRGV